MSPLVLTLVLSAAVMHASWNAILKSSGDRATVLGLIATGHVIVGLLMAPFVSIPDMASWPFIAASTAIHFVYYYLLFHSYRVGDLSQVYPIARGLAPLLVTLGAQIAINEILPLQVWIGVITISAGIVLLSVNSLMQGTPRTAIYLALCTGVIISAYSIADGIGGRVSGDALGYIAWLFICQIVIVLFIFGRKSVNVRTLSKQSLIAGTIGGLISGLAYGLVIYAKTLAPLGAVSALRETSVIFAALIGIFFFGEGPKLVRLLSAAVVMVGVMLISSA